MKKSLILILILTSVNAFADRVGNGGGGWVCYKPGTDEIEWIELVDLYEAKKEFQLSIPQVDPRMDYLKILGEKRDHLRSLSPQFSKVLEPFLESALNNIVFMESDLEVIDDQLWRIRPSKGECKFGGVFGEIKYVQLANFTEYGKVLIQKHLWNDILSSLDKAALIFHEAVYAYLRKEKGDTNSVRTREFVGYLFSDLDKNRLCQKFYDMFGIACADFDAFEWALKFRGTTTEINDIAIDSNGGFYSCGWRATENRGHDIFLGKYNRSGQLQWLKVFGSPYDDECKSITIDAEHNVYISGETWGELEKNKYVDNTDLFIAKFNSEGEMVGLKQYGSADQDIVNDIVVNASGEIFISGNTVGNLFGERPDEDPNHYGLAGFAAKFDSEGNKIWIYYIEGSTRGNMIRAYRLGVGSDHHLYLSGKNNTGQCLIKLDRDGRKIWQREEKEPRAISSGGVDDNMGEFILDQENNIYFKVGNGIKDNSILVKYTSSGERKWEKRITDYLCGRMSIDLEGNLYLPLTFRQRKNIHEAIVRVDLIQVTSEGVEKEHRQILKLKEKDEFINPHFLFRHRNGELFFQGQWNYWNSGFLYSETIFAKLKASEKEKH